MTRSHVIFSTCLALLSCTFAFGDTISGRVTTSAGMPVEKAGVRISPIPDAGKPRVAITTKSGTFSISGLETGYYSITAAKKPFLDTTLYRVEVNEPKYGKKQYAIVLDARSVSGHVYNGKTFLARARSMHTPRADFTDHRHPERPGLPRKRDVRAGSGGR